MKPVDVISVSQIIGDGTEAGNIGPFGGGAYLNSRNFSAALLADDKNGSALQIGTEMMDNFVPWTLESHTADIHFLLQFREVRKNTFQRGALRAVKLPRSRIHVRKRSEEKEDVLSHGQNF